MALRSSLVLLAVLSVARGAAIRNTTLSARQNCDSYTVEGIDGAFADRLLVNFTTAAGDAASFLGENGMSISDYGPLDGPVKHTFVPGNVVLGDGVLEVKVNAYDGSGNVNCGEIQSNDAFLYGSMRTVLKSSGVPGIVEGMFTYLNDNQEADWEILTTTVSEPSENVPAGVWATNQALTPGGQSTHETVPFTFDPAADFHEYRIDWTADATVFYIDGEEKARLTDNVPTEASYAILNMWSNGDPNWSNGPPTQDSTTYIQSIDVYKGYLPKAKGNACSV